MSSQFSTRGSVGGKSRLTKSHVHYGIISIARPIMASLREGKQVSTVRDVVCARVNVVTLPIKKVANYIFISASGPSTRCSQIICL